MKRKGALNGVLICVVAASALIIANKGCEYFPESTFELAKSSRLPKWIATPPEARRSDLELSMTYYSSLWGPNVTFTLQDSKHHVIRQFYGTKCIPRYSLNPPEVDYPAYMPIGVDGTIEVIEHKKMEPLFYVTDDPAVLERFKGRVCI